MNEDGDAVVVDGLRRRALNRQIEAEAQAPRHQAAKQPECHDFGLTFLQ
jgi:hypothetical protein